MIEKYNVWQMLEDYRNDGNFSFFCDSTRLDEITEAENRLLVKFTAAYVKLLLKYGACSIGAFDVYGLRHQAQMDDFIWHVVDVTNFYKQTQKWPDIDDWYVISDDGRGNPIGVDPQGVVWLSDHDSGFEKVKLADDFEEFLYKLLTDTLYE